MTRPDEALGPSEGTETTLELQRLRLDNEDLRLANARLKGSIAEKQDEIIRLGERLGQLQARLDKLHRVAAWTRLRRLNPLRSILRRLG